MSLCYGSLSFIDDTIVALVAIGSLATIAAGQDVELVDRRSMCLSLVAECALQLIAAMQADLASIECWCCTTLVVEPIDHACVRSVTVDDLGDVRIRYGAAVACADAA